MASILQYLWYTMKSGGLTCHAKCTAPPTCLQHHVLVSFTRAEFPSCPCTTSRISIYAFFLPWKKGHCNASYKLTMKSAMNINTKKAGSNFRWWFSILNSTADVNLSHQLVPAVKNRREFSRQLQLTSVTRYSSCEVSPASKLNG